MDTVLAEGSEYADRQFRQVRYGEKRVERVTFTGCTFTRCVFSDVVFQNCKFRGCVFQDCDLRMMRVPGSAFRNVMFRRSKAVGVNWVEGYWSKKGLLDSIGFEECDISHSTFIGLELKKLVMSKCTAKNADFAEAILTQAIFTDTDFVEARFLHTDLTEADFTGARNYAIDVALNTVKKARFSLPEAVNLLRCMNIVLVEP